MVYLNELQYHVNYINVESNRARRFTGNYNFHCVVVIYSNVWKRFSNIKLRVSGQEFSSLRFDHQPRPLLYFVLFNEQLRFSIN